MVKSVVWTQKAQQERKDILSYWKHRNQSNDYSKKLNQLFRIATQLIARHPDLGMLTDYNKVRVKTVNDYLLFYKNEEQQIIVLTIWDSRRNPEKLDVI